MAAKDGQKQPESRAVALLHEFLAGTVGGIASKAAEYPLDTVKVRMQTAGPGIYRHPLHCAKEILQHEGFAALYRGLPVPMLGTALELAILFATNDSIKRAMGGGSNEPLPLSKVLLSGAICGGLVAHLLTPMELIKCRMQTRHYSSAWQCIEEALAEGGMSTLFRGHSATLLREIPGTSVWFGTYEACMRLAVENGIPRDEVSIGWQLLSGAVAGMVYWFVPYPIDTIKSHMQTVEGLPRGRGPLSQLWDVGRHIMLRDGIRGFYPALGGTMVRAAVGNSVLFVTEEQTRHYLKRSFAFDR